MKKFQQRLATWATHNKKRATYFILLPLIFFLHNCSSEVKYHAGIVTTSVSGKITQAGEPVPEKIFIIVRKHNKTLIETSQGYLHRISAEVVFPGADGKYDVEMADAVDEIDLYVIAKGYSVDSHNFRRTLGVGRYELDIDLKKSENWRSEYGYFIKPFISDFIVEPRYKLPPTHQMFLGDWINEVEDDLEKKKKH